MAIQSRHELNPDHIYRDVRPLSVRVISVLQHPVSISSFFICMIAFVFVFPALFDVCLLLSGCFYLIVKPVLTNFDVPFRKRSTLHEMDLKDKDPGGNPQMSRGIYFFGNRKDDGAEIWGANEDLRTHIFVVGTTGAGKTEGLISFSYNSLVWGSGFTYVDGKGDVSLWAKIFSLVRYFGREDDLLVINYMTGNADTTRKRVDKLSNTYNPCVSGNSESIIQLLVSLMDAAGGGGDMWKGRAISFISSYLPALVELRDKDLLLLHIGVIREFMPFPKYFELMQNPEISDRSRTLMQAFLLDVPGYKADKGLAQSSTFNEQYGYQQMQFTRVLSSLADTYGHIYAVEQAEINLADVTLNCRIFLCLLPALEKSRPELANLGKIIVAGMKGMMGGQLGAKIQGYKRELLDTRVTNAPFPYPITFDEFGYFMPEDSALMWAQARSLGFQLIAAGQDLQAFYRTSKEETLAIVGSSMAKIFGKVEDPTDTYDLISKLAGEAYVSIVDGYSGTGDVTGGYRPGDGVRIDKVARVTLQDLKKQVEGEVVFMIKADIIWARLFYAAPKLADYYRANHFIQVKSPEEEEIAELQIDYSSILDQLQTGALDITVADDLSPVTDILAFAGTQHYIASKAGGEVAAIVVYGLLHPDSFVHGVVTGQGDDDGRSAVALVNTPVTEAVDNSIDDLADLVIDRSESSGTEGVDGNEIFNASVDVSPQKAPVIIDDGAALFAAAASTLIDVTLQRESVPLAPEMRDLIRICSFLGGSPTQSQQAAEQIVSIASTAVAYPLVEAPPADTAPTPSEQLDEVMSGLEQLLMDKH